MSTSDPALNTLIAAFIPQSPFLLETLNIFFLIFHTGLSLFNALGWIWKKTRFYNLVSLLITAFSWFGMGIWYGWGYCICTDWHWQVRRALGDTDLPLSYITFLIEHWTGLHPDPYWVDAGTGLVFGLALMLSVYLNVRDKSKAFGN